MVLTSTMPPPGQPTWLSLTRRLASAEAPAGSTQEYSLEVLLEKDLPTTGVETVVPEGFEVSHEDAPEGREGSEQGRSVTWYGGQIYPDEEAAEFSCT